MKKLILFLTFCGSLSAQQNLAQLYCPDTSTLTNVISCNTYTTNLSSGSLIKIDPLQILNLGTAGAVTLIVKPANTNNGPTILIVNGVGYGEILSGGTSLVPGSITAGSIYPMVFNGSNYTLVPVSSVDASYTCPFTGCVTETQSAKNVQVLSVTDFGAKGDGVTDDSLAIDHAVTAACNSAANMLYIPGGTYLTHGISVCKGLHIKCGSSVLIPTVGSGTTLQVTGANWGLSNPNADSAVTNPSGNQVYGLNVEGCTWDISQNASALGAWRIKGILESTFRSNIIYSNNNPNPSIVEDGGNWQKNNGDYHNDFYDTFLYDNAGAASTATGILVKGDTGGSNDNHHYGGFAVRFGTCIRIENGNNNSFVDFGCDNWNTNGVLLTTNGTGGFAQGNNFQGMRFESLSVAGTAIQEDAGTKQNHFFTPYHSGSYTFMSDAGDGNTCVPQCLYGTPGSPIWFAEFSNPAANGLLRVGINKLPAADAAGGLDIHGKLTTDNVITTSNISSVTTGDLTSAIATLTETAQVQFDGSGNTGVDTTVSTIYTAAKFTVGGSNIFTSGCSVQLKATAGVTNPTQSFTGFIYNDSAGQPGTIVFTGLSVKYGTLTTSYAEYLLGNTSSVQLTANTAYWCVIKETAAPTGTTISINTANVGTNTFATSPDAVTWTTSNVSGWVKVYSRTAAAINATSTNAAPVISTTTNGPAISGTSNFGVGVQGTSTNNVGVNGTTVNSNAVQGTTTAGNAVQGVSTSGFGGVFISSSGGGVFAQSTTGNPFSATYGAIGSYTIDKNGHHIATGTVPTIPGTDCGTGSSITGNDHYGNIVTAGTISTCKVTFVNTYSAAPSIILVWIPATGVGAPITASSATSFTFTASTSTTYSYLIFK